MLHTKLPRSASNPSTAVRQDSNAGVFDVPHFIIGGAAKCGTTSLHYLLAAHSKIRIPASEIHFLDVDDALMHPDFLWSAGASNRWPDFGGPESDAGRWYQTQFPRDRADALIGEDSTTYLHSPVAARRVTRHLPTAKMIFALRDPVERALSQYRHLIQSGRATADFQTSALTQSEDSFLPRFVRCSADGTDGLSPGLG